MTGPTTADRSSYVPESFHHDAPFCWVSSKEVLLCCSCCARLQRWETQRVLLSYTEKKRFGSGWRWQAFEFISISEKKKFRRFSGEIKDQLWRRLLFNHWQRTVLFLCLSSIYECRERETTDWCCCCHWTYKHLPQLNMKVEKIKWINVPGLIVQCIIPHA